MAAATAHAVGRSGIYQHSVALTGYVSTETGKAPTAYLWLPEGCERVKAVMLAQQNMTEEQLYKNERFRSRMSDLGIGLIWVAPWFTQDWSPQSGCQQVFEEMMSGLAGQSGHPELERAAVIPFGHSAQATFPWNFAAWNSNRTLCVISFHGDAPRTNLCGYGTSNVEWGRTRNIDGIPGLMVEGEYEWWEARVRPALAFRMMYPKSCISFLCDAGAGHFDLREETMEYMALFIKKAMEQRWSDKQLRAVDPRNGYLACRYSPDIPANDGNGAKDDIFRIDERPALAPYAEYTGDRHDAFWYFDSEMASLTERRYADTRGKQYVELDKPECKWNDRKDLLTVSVPDGVRVEVICGPLRPLAGSKKGYTGRRHAEAGGSGSRFAFEVYPYECGTDNPKRSFSAWLVAVKDGDSKHKRAVKPFEIKINK